MRRAIYQGDGTTRTTAELGSMVTMVTTAAGNGQCCTFESGKRATETAIDFPFGTTLAVAPDGTLYIGDAGLAAIRRVSPAGIATTIAGTGDNVDAGDGGPAILASVREVNIWGLSCGPDGSVYIVDGYSRVRQVTPDGIINTIGGGPQHGYGGDGGPALAARMNSPTHAVPAPDGSVYVADASNRRIRRLSPSLPRFNRGDTIVSLIATTACCLSVRRGAAQSAERLTGLTTPTSASSRRR